MSLIVVDRNIKKIKSVRMSSLQRAELRDPSQRGLDAKHKARLWFREKSGRALEGG